MNAYTLVDNQIRKKLDEMLKTWKEPVPGSLDSRPVFPVEVTRTIENALIKARTAAVQLQQQQAKSQQEMLARSRPTATPPVPWRNTPTPPQNTSRRAPLPLGQSNGQAYGGNGVSQQYSNHQVYRSLTVLCIVTRANGYFGRQLALVLPLNTKPHLPHRQLNHSIPKHQSLTRLRHRMAI